VLRDAINGLTTARRTAIGSGILKSIDAIAEVDERVAPSASSVDSASQAQPLPEGTYLPNIIVVLTDGVSNSGPDPLEAAQQALDRGLRVYTIGFGTENRNLSFPDCRQSFQGGGGGGGGFGRRDQQFGGFLRGIDEPSLKQIAAMTGGDYFSATSAGELQKVFKSLPTTLITRQETTEISFIFTAVGAFFAALAILLALLWHPLP
jgi:Ca-activated chloride channel family protein